MPPTRRQEAVPVPRRGNEKTRQALLAAATDLFGRHGYRSTALADVAREAGVVPTTIYIYFANKEELFLAALDQDASAVIHEGLLSVADPTDPGAWRAALFTVLFGAVECHPLARRVLKGLEPDFTQRILDIPALDELRALIAERLRGYQKDGLFRDDVDAAAMASGATSVIVSLLMSTFQFGVTSAAPFGPDIITLFDAAFETPTTRGRRRRLRASPQEEKP